MVEYCNDGSCFLNRKGERHLAHDGASANLKELGSANEDQPNHVAIVEEYCNDGNCSKTRRGEKHPAHDMELPDYCEIEYVGGHKAYPTHTKSVMTFYEDHIEIENPRLSIPYSKIYNIENADKDKISLVRVAMFGVIGALWKKNHIYTVLQYKDELDDQTIIVDFDSYIDDAQPLIYHKMLEFRKK